MDANDQAYHSGLSSTERAGEKTGTPLMEKVSASGSPPQKERSQMSIKDISRAYSGGGFGSSGPLSLNAMTPTSNLAGRLDSISLAKRGGGARNSSMDSPTSDYASGNFPSGNFSSGYFPSLSESDHGYDSLSSMPSLAKGGGISQRGRVKTSPKPALSSASTMAASDEDMKKDTEMEEESAGDDEEGRVVEDDDIERDSSAYMASEQLLSLQCVGSVAQDESPGAVPVVGEDIEISTFSSASAPASLVMDFPKQENFGVGLGLSKRERIDTELMPSSRKTPRLSPEPFNAGKKAVRVATIVSSPSGERLSPHTSSSRRKGQSPVTFAASRDHSPSPTPSPASMPTFTATPSTIDPTQLEKLFLPGASLTLPVSSLAGAAATPNGFQQLIQQIVQQQLQLQQQQQQKKKSGVVEMIGVKPVHSQTPKAHVDFTSVQDIARSDRPRKVPQGPSSMEVDGVASSSSSVFQSQVLDRLERVKPAGSPAPVSGTRLTTDAHHHGFGAAAETRDRPGPTGGSPLPPSSPMNVINLISPQSSSRQTSRSPVPSRSLSPHSPQVGKASSSESSMGAESQRGDPQDMEIRVRGSVDNNPEAKEEEMEVRQKGEEAPPSVLLQVSEAHLALYPDEDGDTPLHMAVIHENVKLTRYLIHVIKRVQNKNTTFDVPNSMRQTPLHLAIITKQAQMVQMLREAGASVNYPDRKGNSAVHLAAARKDVDMLKILAKFSSPLPDFNAKNFAGLTPAHVATKEASIEVLKYLFQMGANKNASDTCSGRAPIHYAVEAENFILVNFLLENSCNVNAPTYSGNTPLHIAAGRRLKEIVALLMAYGANPALANGEGDFPSDLPASLLMQRAKLNAH